MKSIYQELVDIANKDLTFMAMDFGDAYYDADEEDELNPLYEGDDDNEDEIDSNLIYMPLERTFLCTEEGRQVDVDDFHYAICNIPFTESQLEKYVDGGIYKGYPIAVSFRINKKDYTDNLDILTKEGLAIVSYTNGTCFSFIDGVEVFETSVGGDSIRIVMGFAKQGVLPDGKAGSAGKD